METDYTQFGQQTRAKEPTFELEVERQMLEMAALEKDPDAIAEMSRAYRAYKKIYHASHKKPLTREQELHQKAVARRKKRKRGGKK